MRVDMQTLYLVVPLAPLFGAIVAGLFGRLVGRTGAHVVTIAGVAVSFVASVLVFQDVLAGHTFNGTVYTWMTLGDLHFEVGFLVDALTAMMMLVVTFVSLMVHVYTIGYMHDDPGYQRFFSYISLFTFSMLMLVMSNNFLQLFFGWEAVGLVSYLLIGFWYTKETAIYANLKAFLVNRVGDFGFILGIGLVLAHFGSLDYATVFAKAPSLASETITLWPDTPWMLMSVIGILLFIGAMGKSAQFPLHVWLPDSMEGPTPISALIHAATMVTAGIFMVARMSPLYELSDTALSFIMVIGAITALFMGFLGMVQNDIKRVVAYSTLSQLGYMTVALGASAYSVAVFHLMTHAFFKALLFLAAGSVIIAMHHNQDIRYMGGLKKYMPITWVTSLIGSLALIGTPFLSGFYSKESIIEAAKVSHLPGAGFAYFAVLAGVFVTAFYSFRMYFLVFHGKERFHQGHGHGNEPDAHHGHAGAGHDGAHGQGHDVQPHETPWVVTGPLLALALPSLAIGYMTIEPMLFGDFFGSAIYVADRHPVMHELNQEFHGAMEMGLHALATLPFWLAVAGVGLSAFFYLKRPDIPAAIAQRFSFLHRMLLNKYWFDELYSWVFAKGARALGGSLWRRGDQNMIDGFFVNGSAHLVERFSRLVKAFQSGYIYHYAFAMLIGVFALVTWFARLN
ncbi:MAG: NADH-quinone oxidoreductase subunit L [Thiobacillus sp. SCN 63-57]|uniref:NADH-quinone oxidoreductase subunit L n=1 Tax=Thiobacillus sp. SCN 63-57 TaxID=1660145 RepID=UPI00086A53C9|nr:NADH-quinone oxidoreductase subunit L [Thiobacillus sp. SCN 63-57]ODV03142.1 MAG: NADH-quinone oxidoreductase subunit L [Thiobacillus sp. SCN 63-57]